MASGSLALLIWSFFAKVQDVVVLSGSLRSKNPVAKVVSPMAGRVQKVFVAPSQRVDSGQALLALDVSDQEIRLGSLRVRLQQLESSYRSYQRFSNKSLASLRSELSVNQDLLRRYQNLALSGAMSDVQLLNQRNRVVQLETRVAEANHADADKNAEFGSQKSQLMSEIALLDHAVSRSTVYSPIHGIVQSLDLPSQGVFLASGSNIAEIVPSGILSAQVKLPSQYRDAVQVGSTAMVDVDAFPAREFGFLLSEISSVSPTTFESSSSSIPKTYLADLKLLRSERSELLNLSQLLPGMKVTARVTLRTKPVITTVFEFFDNFFTPMNEER
ncbi:HlyD family secretion protein [Synechococcus sp. GEYO]|uniref:HlyD family secretion protein n=1 Tax=Synechococcus sp. GEYO TaxID=2575511 RepID=UPI001482FD4E|nr:HlyD family efflux transporter periplasmic adaptor subunit [Synechococcus sp. GEYO]